MLSRLSLSYTASMVTNADQWKWRQRRISAVSMKATRTFLRGDLERRPRGGETTRRGRARALQDKMIRKGQHQLKTNKSNNDWRSVWEPPSFWRTADARSYSYSGPPIIFLPIQQRPPRRYFLHRKKLPVIVSVNLRPNLLPSTRFLLRSEQSISFTEKNLIPLDCVRLQLDHTASRACKPNALDVITTRSASRFEMNHTIFRARKNPKSFWKWCSWEAYQTFWLMKKAVQRPFVDIPV